jgi:large subunit ribosomal protein L18
MKKLKRQVQTNRTIRHHRIRATIVGTQLKPRLCVFRSLKALEAQIIDDDKGKTICAARSSEVKAEKVEGKSTKVAQSYLLGKLLAEKAKAKGIVKVVFDRGGYKFHGRVAALAEGAREGGLEF